MTKVDVVVIGAGAAGLTAGALLAKNGKKVLVLDKATSAIEQFLLNERKRKIVADDLQALRAAAKIEYLGDFKAQAERERRSWRNTKRS